MKDLTQRLSALQRLAEDLGATEAERENARCRIEEHKSKYGEGGAAPRRPCEAFYDWDAVLRQMIGEMYQDMLAAARRSYNYCWLTTRVETVDGQPPFFEQGRCRIIPIDLSPADDPTSGDTPERDNR